jgi:UDP-N-acetylmuramyl pentapeptide phosphotransferase/UDP-N-acetylglucosamine-1-phosphate transferase
MYISELNILIPFLMSFLVSFFMTYYAVPRVILLSKKFRLSAMPKKRSSHKKSIPIFGGIAILLGVFFSLIFFSSFNTEKFILASLVIVFFIGFFDDLVGLSPFKKIIGQIIAILIIIYFGDIQINSMHGVLGVYALQDYVAKIFTVFVAIVITNSFNLIDGVDGLASGIGVISFFCFGIITVIMKQFDMTIIALSFIGALLAFLKYNFYPAKLFMGDTGSLLVGMALSILAINLINTGLVFDSIDFSDKGPVLAISFLALPLFDTLRVFISRIYYGRHPLLPGRGHIHHALLDLQIGHKRTSLLLWFLSILIILISFSLLILNINLSISILTLLVFSILFIPFFLIRKRV